jgi:hypothetical protein
LTLLYVNVQWNLFYACLTFH